MRYVTTNTSKAPDPNAKNAQYLREVTDDRGHTTVLSTIPLKQLSTNTVRPKEFRYDPALAARALNRGQRPPKGFGPLQSSQLREIADNKRRTALANEKRVAALRAAEQGAAKPKAKRTGKTGK